MKKAVFIILSFYLMNFTTFSYELKHNGGAGNVTSNGGAGNVMSNGGAGNVMSNGGAGNVMSNGGAGNLAAPYGIHTSLDEAWEICQNKVRGMDKSTQTPIGIQFKGMKEGQVVFECIYK